MMDFNEITKEQLAQRFRDGADPMSQAYGEWMGLSLLVATRDIEKSLFSLGESIINNSKSNDELAKKVYYLNIIVTIATVIGTIAAILTAIF